MDCDLSNARLVTETRFPRSFHKPQVDIYKYLLFLIQNILTPQWKQLHTTPVDTFEYEDLTEKVYKALKEMILKGELAPGTKLRQEEISESLGVSRTPLLAALSKLQKEMLVEMIPRRGSYVRKCSLEEMYEFADVRMRLEPLGARSAAENADPEGLARLSECLKEYKESVASGDRQAIKESDYHFHTEIMALSGNKVLRHIIAAFNIVLFSNQRGLLKPPEDSLVEHQEIYDRIAAGEPDAAEKAMILHLVNIKEGITALAGIK